MENNVKINGVFYSKEDIFDALELLSSNVSFSFEFKTVDRGDEYSLLYKDSYYPIKRVHELMSYRKINSYSVTQSLSIRQAFAKLGFTIYPRKKIVDKYLKYKNTTLYNEKYKWDFAKKYKGCFSNISDISSVNSIVETLLSEKGINFRGYYLTHNNIFSWLNSSHPQIIQKAFLKLFDKTDDLKTRINNFRFLIKEYLLNLDEFNNKDLSDVGFDTANFFLFADNYEEHFLCTTITVFNDYAKYFNISFINNNDSREQRYIDWSKYLIDYVIPLLDNCEPNVKHTLLDAQDFIWNFKHIIGFELDIPSKIRNFLSSYDIGYVFSSAEFKKDIVTMFGGKKDSYIPSDYCYNSYCKASQWDRNKIFFFERDNDKYKYLGENAKYTGKVWNGESLYGEWNDGEFTIYKALTSPEEKKVENKEDEIMNKQDKNQILYGPPGTGKTYNTVVEAMKIIEPKLIQYNNVINYSLLKEKFDEYKKQGRIEFVTFHQSYSYEDFVEGIKPILNSDEISYIRKEGIFKQISKTAIEKQINKEQFNFVFENLSVYKLWLPDRDGIYDYCLQNSCVVLDWGEEYDVSSCCKREDIEEIVPISHPDRFTIVSHLNLFKLWIDNDLNNDKDVIIIVPGSRYSIKAIAHITKENGEYKYNPEFEHGHHRRDVKWLKTNINISSNNIYDSCFVPPTLSGMYTEKLQKHKEALMELLNNTDNSKTKNCVLIIDEINRGNISKIFGELITLIEEDKRLGEANEVTVKLPYAEEGEPAFGVPSNLYIIGTMNTSDRSIASVDIALRRRFKFKEMMPDSSVVPAKIENLDFKKIFETLNTKIKILLDRDHQVGHSYFIGIDTIENLKQVWFDSIIPLLNEYFYGDWEKLKLVIPGFISSTKIPDYLKESCDEEYYYEFKTINEFEDNNEFRLALTLEKFNDKEKSSDGE